MFLHSYTGADGKSHPKEYEDAPIGKISIDDAEGIAIRTFVAGTFIDWHNTPRRCYMVTLGGEAEIGYADGTKKRMKPGDVHFEDDVTGQGHTFRVIGDKPRITLVIPVR